MISPELLRRYRCFGPLGDDQLRVIVMISAGESFKRGAVLFKEEQPAQALCLLTTGSVDLSFTIEQEDAPKSRKDLPVGEINAGEMFGVSALVAPNVFTATARASQDGSLLKIDGAALRKLFDEDPHIGHNVMCPMVKALAERLQATRVQLAAARAFPCGCPRPATPPMPREGPAGVFV